MRRRLRRGFVVVVGGMDGMGEDARLLEEGEGFED